MSELQIGDKVQTGMKSVTMSETNQISQGLKIPKETTCFLP